MSTTHVAGPTIQIQNRIIQRCAICGEKLCDNLNTMAPLNPDGSPPGFPTWAEQALIQIDGNRSLVIGEFHQAEGFPKDFCLELVE